jgi:hypothetical protein
MNGIYRAGLLEDPEVHQAASGIMAQLGVSSVEAIALLGAHAANTSWPLVDVACDVLAGRLRLSSPGGGVAPNRTAAPLPFSWRAELGHPRVVGRSRCRFR